MIRPQQTSLTTPRLSLLPLQQSSIKKKRSALSRTPIKENQDPSSRFDYSDDEDNSVGQQLKTLAKNPFAKVSSSHSDHVFAHPAPPIKNSQNNKIFKSSQGTDISSSQQRITTGNKLTFSGGGRTSLSSKVLVQSQLWSSDDMSLSQDTGGRNNGSGVALFSEPAVDDLSMMHRSQNLSFDCSQSQPSQHQTIQHHQIIPSSSQQIVNNANLLLRNATASRIPSSSIGGSFDPSPQASASQHSSFGDYCTPQDAPIQRIAPGEFDMQEDRALARNDYRSASNTASSALMYSTPVATASSQAASDVLSATALLGQGRVLPTGALGLTGGKREATGKRGTEVDSLAQNLTACSINIPLNGNTGIKNTPCANQNIFFPSLDNADTKSGKKGVQTFAYNVRLYQDFEIISELGKGSYGKVYKCRHRTDGCLYAIKKNAKKLLGEGRMSFQLREVFALSCLHSFSGCPNSVLHYHTSWVEDQQLHIQTEFCTGGDLSTQLKSGVFNEQRVLSVCLQISQALAFMHSHQMAHMDVKLENILEAEPGSYRLSDFGLTVPLVGPQSPAVRRQFDSEGDRRYLSRELMLGEKFDNVEKADIFALGLSLYELCGGVLPSNGSNWDQIRYGVVLPLPDLPASCLLFNLIKSMIHSNPLHRPAASEISAYLQQHLSAVAISKPDEINVTSAIVSDMTPLSSVSSSFQSPGSFTQPGSTVSTSAHSRLQAQFSQLQAEFQRIKQENDLLRSREALFHTQ